MSGFYGNENENENGGKSQECRIDVYIAEIPQLSSDTHFDHSGPSMNPGFRSGLSLTTWKAVGSSSIHPYEDGL
jgi:hypothetical protein